MESWQLNSSFDLRSSSESDQRSVRKRRGAQTLARVGFQHPAKETAWALPRVSCLLTFQRGPLRVSWRRLRGLNAAARRRDGVRRGEGDAVRAIWRPDGDVVWDSTRCNFCGEINMADANPDAMWTDAYAPTSAAAA